MNAPDLHELQQRLAQARTECACWACTGQTERLQETHFIAAMLTLRIRHRQGSAQTAARACTNLELHDAACHHDAAAGTARTRG